MLFHNMNLFVWAIALRNIKISYAFNIAVLKDLKERLMPWHCRSTGPFCHCQSRDCIQCYDLNDWFDYYY